MRLFQRAKNVSAFSRNVSSASWRVLLRLLPSPSREQIHLLCLLPCLLPSARRQATLDFSSRHRYRIGTSKFVPEVLGFRPIDVGCKPLSPSPLDATCPQWPGQAPRARRDHTSVSDEGSPADIVELGDGRSSVMREQPIESRETSNFSARHVSVRIVVG